MQPKPNEKTRKLPTGISERHSRSCRSRLGGSCNCEPSYRAFVYDRRAEVKDDRGHVVRHGGKVRETFAGKGALAAAKAWRADATSQMNAGKRIGPSAMTLRQAADAWLAGAEAEPPTVLTRSGVPYKPGVVREYRRTLNSFVLDDLGDHRLSDIRRADLQALVDRLLGEGRSGSTIRNILMPLRVLYRHALERDEVGTNPTQNLRLPNGHKARDRAATATEAAELLTPLPDDVRPIYATAFYAGLRRGELRAIRWNDIDLAAGIIRVSRGWDDVAGEIAPKSEKGTRTVPITALLRDHLTELKARTGRDGNAFVFGPHPTRPFTPSYIRKRANDAWEASNVARVEPVLRDLAPYVEKEPLREAALRLVRFRLDPTDENAAACDAAAKGVKVDTRSVPAVALLNPIGLHECRHTFVSLMHDAGLSLERIGDYVGHSSAYMTDRYRHLLAGHEAEAARLLDEYLARADTASRVEQLEADAE